MPRPRVDHVAVVVLDADSGLDHVVLRRLLALEAVLLNQRGEQHVALLLREDELHPLGQVVLADGEVRVGDQLHEVELAAAPREHRGNVAVLAHHRADPHAQSRELRLYGVELLHLDASILRARRRARVSTKQRSTRRSTRRSTEHETEH